MTLPVLSALSIASFLVLRILDHKQSEARKRISEHSRQTDKAAQDLYVAFYNQENMDQFGPSLMSFSNKETKQSADDKASLRNWTILLVIGGIVCVSLMVATIVAALRVVMDAPQ